MPVEVLRLPTYPSANPDPGPKRLMLPQGEFALLHPACPEIRFLGLLGFAPGVSRGGHRHPEKEEFFYLLRGAVTLRSRDAEGSPVVEHRLLPGDLARIPAGVAHVYTGTEASEAIEFSATPFKQGDAVRVEV